MARVKNLRQNVSFNFINEENHGDFGVREVTVILWSWWSFTLNHNIEVGNSLIK